MSKSSLHRLLKGERASGTIARIVDYRVCRLLRKDEFYQVINRGQPLRSMELLGEEDMNVPLLLALLEAVLDQEEARGAVLELVTKRYKTELRQMLGETLPESSLNGVRILRSGLLRRRVSRSARGPRGTTVTYG